MSITEQIVREAPEVEARKLGLLDTAKALADKPIVLPEQQVAALTPQQLQAIELGDTGIGAYQQYLANALQSQAAGLSSLEQAAQQFVNPTQQNINQFMNPYQDAVRDEINRAFNIAQQGADAQAIASGAFGGDRQGVQRAELERNRASALAQAQAQAFLNAQNRQLAGASGLASIAPQYATFAGQQGQLGALGQQLGAQDINTLLGLGSLGQQQAQTQLDVNRQNLLSQIFEPYQRVGFLSDIYQGAPTSAQTIQTQSGFSSPSPSPLQQIAGYGIAGLSALNAFGGGGGGGLFS